MLLYAIANRGSLDENDEKLVHLSANWASEGVNWIQIREKSTPYEELLPLTARVVEAARRANGGTGGRTRVLVNAGLAASTPVALESGADGVHVPGGLAPEDLADAIAEIRSQWATRRPSPSRPAISVACRAADDVRAAREAGASLALFAPVFEKPLPGGSSLPGKGLEALADACRAGRQPASRPELPVLALGGVTLANAAQCVAAGAAGIAAIRLFWEQDPNPDRDWRSLAGTAAGAIGM
jgi:thiamine-phosphate pyrophosphorylase